VQTSTPGRDRDDTLVEAARGGDTDAVEVLVERYQLRLFNYARALTRSESDAEDLAQETFIRAFRSLDRFRGDASFKTWLYRIATNVARTHLGKRSKQAPVWEHRLEAEEVPEERMAGPEDSVETATIRRQALDRALASLSEDMRLPLVLHDVEGLEYQEIAAVLEIPIGTVMSRIFRARKRLRPLLTGLLGRPVETPHLDEVAR